MAYVTKDPLDHVASRLARASSVYNGVDDAGPLFDPSTSLTGSVNGLMSDNLSGSVKVNVELEHPIIPARIYLENSHQSGTLTTRGTKNFEIYGTNNYAAFRNLTYSDTTNLTLLGSFQAAQHVASDIADPQYFVLSGVTSAYRYYVIRIVDDWGGSYVGFRILQIQYDDAVTQPTVPTSDKFYPTEYTDTTVKGTSRYSSSYGWHHACNPALSLIGAWSGTSWLTPSSTNTNQKLNIDLGQARTVNKIYLEAIHENGSFTNNGIKNFIIYGTNSSAAFDNVTYADTTDLTELGTFVGSEHIPSNVSDPQYFYFYNTTSYRYYILRCADTVGGTSTYMGIRQVELWFEDWGLGGGYFPSSSSPAVSSGGQPIVLPTIRQIVDMPYSLMESIRTLVTMLYGIKLSAIVSLRYGDLTELRKITNLRYGDLSLIRRTIDVLYGDLSKHRNIVNLDYDLMAQVRGLVNLPYHIIQGELRALIDLQFDLQLLDIHKNIINIIYSIASGESVEEITTLSVINEDAYELNPFHIDIEKDEGNPCIRIEIRSNDETDFVKNPAKKMVQTTVNADVYTVLVEDSEISTQVSEDGTEVIDVYSFTMMSPCFLLDSPNADLLSEELSGMASEIVAYVASTVPEFDAYGIDYNQLDWHIPPGVFVVNDMSPIAIIEKIAAACGGILQSKNNGTLEVRPEYPTNIPAYDTATPTVFLTDQENFYSVNSTSERYNDYNNFLIGDIEPDVAGLTIKIENISSTTREVKVFQVPFDNDDTIQLQTSGGDHVEIREYGIEDLLIEGEEVEIVDGEGTTSSPIYNLVKYSYAETNLGSITATEDKTLSSATSGNSIVRVDYYTKYRKFTAKDEKIENVQFWPEVV